MYSRLLTHESRLSHLQTNLTAAAEFLANSTTTTSGARGRGLFRGKGGNRSHGRGRNSGRFSSTHFSPNRPQCQVCHRQGHTTIQCYYRVDHSYQTPPPSSLSANITFASPYSYDTASSVDSNWYPDSAATHHFTHNFSNLSLNPSEYKGEDQVRVGDGNSVPIHHVGTSNIPSQNGLSHQEHTSTRSY
ncbi:hypothetical protein I3760_16G112600 [Carya illinoinensis]|nr:hypothetical protein I3760_16G112600 [Carya illinoinensis]